MCIRDSLESASKELGVIKGDIKLSQNGQTKMAILASDTAIKAGDMIVTAGSSGIYPKGIPVGRVKEVQTESHGVTKYASIEPYADVLKVETVVVITKMCIRDRPGKCPFRKSGRLFLRSISKPRYLFMAHSACRFPGNAI